MKAFTVLEGVAAPLLRPNINTDIIIRIERLRIHLGEPLGGAKHRDRLDRLVGRDHHHRAGAGRGRGIGHIDRAEYVGLDPLAPVLLEQRNVLERGGVEHHVRPELRHQAEDAVAVAHVGEAAFDAGAGLVGREHLQDRVQGGLRVLDYQDSRRAEGERKGKRK